MPQRIPTVSVVLIVLETIAISNSMYMNIFDFASSLTNNSFWFLLYLLFIHGSTFRSFYYSITTNTKPRNKEQEGGSINCRQCKHKVYIRDHHCVYIGQCVGKYNFKFFFSYLFFVYMVCANNMSRVYYLYNSIDGSVLEFLSGMDWNFKSRLLYFVISSIFGIFFTGQLFAYQIYMILNDMTNFEHAKKIK